MVTNYILIIQGEQQYKLEKQETPAIALPFFSALLHFKVLDQISHAEAQLVQIIP